MAWIKRNLYFLVGGVAAVVLLGLAGWYLFAKWSLNNSNLEELNKAYAELERIAGVNPNPGNSKTDNIAIAKEQQAKLREEIKKTAQFFAPIPAIPDSTNVTSQDYAAALHHEVDELGRTAASASVNLPPKYNFSFEAQRNLVKFAPGSLAPLAAQLGEVKTICGILYQAKINSLDGIRRERVSADDANGLQTDYLDATSATNDLAVMSPYELTFHCFSPELAAVLAGFASDPHGFLVKTVNVELGGATSGTDQAGAAPGYPPGAMPPGYPAGADAYNRFNPYAAAAAAAAAAATPAVGRGGLPILLDEKPLKITLLVNVVKLQPKK